MDRLKTIPSTSPAALGYRWPAEWEPHEGTWISWPHPEGISFPDSYDRVVPTLVAMARAIAASETLNINVRDRSEEKTVRSYFGDDFPHKARFFHVVTNEPWCRDHGPIFLTKTSTDPKSNLAVIDWRYNAWGGKYPPYEDDDEVPTKIAQAFELPLWKPELILEGGSIEGNGDGTLLTTESCLLNPNRNPQFSKAEIENFLRDYLGVAQILWLGDGIEGDDTDGHIDDLSRFVNRTTVLTVVEHDKADRNYVPLKENLEKLKTMKLQDGTPLNVVELPMPRRIDREDLRLPASYANFYITNESVVVPVYDDPADEEATRVVAKCFPTRKIIPISCRELIWGLGAFHCLTQQQPQKPQKPR